MLRCETTVRNASPAALRAVPPVPISLQYRIVSYRIVSYPVPVIRRHHGHPSRRGMGFPVNRRKVDDPCRAHAMGGVMPWRSFL